MRENHDLDLKSFLEQSSGDTLADIERRLALPLPSKDELPDGAKALVTPGVDDVPDMLELCQVGLELSKDDILGRIDRDEYAGRLKAALASVDPDDAPAELVKTRPIANIKYEGSEFGVRCAFCLCSLRLK